MTWPRPIRARKIRSVAASISNARHHLLEVGVPFLLIRDARILLRESLQTDAGLEHVHRIKVILPALVEDLDEDELLQIRELFAKEHPAHFNDGFAQLRRIAAERFDLPSADVGAKAPVDGLGDRDRFFVGLKNLIASPTPGFPSRSHFSW